MGDTKNTCKILVGKREGESPFGIPVHIIEASIEINDRVVQCVSAEWIKLT
jgi:hypothetical protein